MALVYTSGTVLRTEVREGVILNFVASRPKLIGGARAEYLADPIRKN